MFMQIISVGDVVSDTCKLGDCGMFFAKAELFLREKALLRDISDLSVGDDSFE